MASRRDYEAVADAIEAAGHEPTTESALHVVALKMADYFAKDNPRFDAHRFFDACDLTKGR